MKTSLRMMTLGFTALCLVSGQPAQSHACTGILLVGKDGTVVRSRTIEWGPFDLKGRLDIDPRGHVFKAQTMPDGKVGHSWKSKYGMVGTSALGRALYGDGINEVELSVGAFYLPGFSSFPDYNPKQAKSSIAPTDVAGFLLTQFRNVKSVGFPFPLHWIVTEPSGKSIVIEFVKKKMVIYDAPLGVITNSPPYDWHITNLRNYVNLSALSLPAKKIDGLNFAPLGAGSGMIGLPGDFTPPSRFVRAVAFAKSARKTEGGYDTVRETFRILDNFNVPLGAAEGTGTAPKKKDVLYSATQWTTAADLTNRVLYYHTQFSRRVRKVDLKKIDFTKLGGKMITRPLDKTRKEDVLDLTPGR